LTQSRSAARTVPGPGLNTDTGRGRRGPARALWRRRSRIFSIWSGRWLSQLRRPAAAAVTATWRTVTAPRSGRRRARVAGTAAAAAVAVTSQCDAHGQGDRPA